MWSGGGEADASGRVCFVGRVRSGWRSGEVNGGGERAVLRLAFLSNPMLSTAIHSFPPYEKANIGEVKEERNQ